MAELSLFSTVHDHVNGMRLENDMQGSSAAIQCCKQSSTVSEGSLSKWGQREGEALESFLTFFKAFVQGMSIVRLI